MRKDFIAAALLLAAAADHHELPVLIKPEKLREPRTDLTDKDRERIAAAEQKRAHRAEKRLRS